jgi:hypothetical protein
MTSIRTPSRSIAVATASILVALLLLSVGSASAANTRNVYFGAPSAICPLSPQDTACGGGIDANGAPTQGKLVFSPPNVSTSVADSSGAIIEQHYVAYRVVAKNTGGQTLSHVVVLGGSAAGQTVNSLFPPPTSPSLPTGFTYRSVAVLPGSGSSPSCAVTSASFRCDFGNIAAGTGATTLEIVLNVPATITPDPATVQPWNELQVNEGSSTTGTNVDSFYAIGDLGVRTSTQDNVESYILPAGMQLATDTTFAATALNPATTKINVPSTSNGEDARINEVPIATAAGCAPNSPKLICFLQESNVFVLQPTNLTVTGLASDTFTNAAPLRLDFRWEASALPGGATQNKLQIVHDGVLVPACTTPLSLTTAQPACRLPTVKFADRDLGITVYSLVNGNWKPGY